MAGHARFEAGGVSTSPFARYEFGGVSHSLGSETSGLKVRKFIQSQETPHELGKTETMTVDSCKHS